VVACVHDDADCAQNVSGGEEFKFEFAYPPADADIKWFDAAQSVTSVLSGVGRAILGPFAATAEDFGRVDPHRCEEIRRRLTRENGGLRSFCYQCRNPARVIIVSVRYYDCIDASG
jgi:hypothetical protein